jgi:hypothetical protein
MANLLSPLMNGYSNPELEDSQRKSIQEQENLYKYLEGQAQPNLFQIAGALARPTKTGNWLEALGAGTEEYGRQMAEREKLEPSRMQMRAEIASKKYQMQQQGEFRNLTSNLYSQDEQGKQKVNTNVLQQMMSIDPKATNEILSGKKVMNEENLKDATNRFIQNPSDKKAIADIAMYSPDGFKAVLEIANNSPKLRSLLGKNENGESQEVTPFDHLMVVDNPLIAGQAKTLRKKVLDGTLSEEKAISIATQLVQIYTTSNDKRELHGALSGIKQQLAEAQLEKIKKENANLNPEQKEMHKKIILPAIVEAGKGVNALAVLDTINDIIPNAPSGFLSGYTAETWGKLTGSEKNTALRQLLQQTNTLLNLVPRLPGAQSNFDANNIKLSIGKLEDPTLTNAQRRKLVESMRKSYQNLIDKGQEIEEFWNDNRKLHPSFYGKEKKPEIPPLPNEISVDKDTNTGISKFKVLGVEKGNK